MPLVPDDVPSIQDSSPAVAFTLGLDAGELKGWTVVGELVTGQFVVASSICCTPHLMGQLAAVVGQVAEGVAEGTRPRHVT